MDRQAQGKAWVMIVLVVALAAACALGVTGTVMGYRQAALAREQARQAEMAARTQQIRAEETAKRAAEERTRAEAVGRFLRDALAAADPQAGTDRGVKVREALDQAAARLDGGELSGDPAAAAAVRSTLGKTYLEMGLYAEAEKNLASAVELRKKTAGEGDPAAAKDAAMLEEARRRKGE